MQELQEQKISIIDDEVGEDGIVTKLVLQCEECGDLLEIVFENEFNTP